MQPEIYGPVRYVYQETEDDIEIIIEGDSAWVKEIVSDLSLEEKGWLQSLEGGKNTEAINESLISEEDNVGSMGPTPNPSSIPIVLRPIGSLDIDSKLDNYGAAAQEPPTIEEMAQEFDQLKQPEPKSGPLVQDPMSEAWLAELFKIALSRFGVTTLSFDIIEAVASDKLAEMEGMELELWLEKLYRMGKLMKKTAGSSISFGPVPAWMNS
ncbi:MAG: hypothetical protein VYE59_03770 [Candidatus Thermoplasmatota archaeon]|nr:hypothetical protein [Candidatus Thermoplasmatota archaeon]MEE3134807.1 hypothetical protein [Candidatus Thermoplasmatota archaeon]|tara:strand:+ start:809 stop:1441 length:633 start_codon:yes stop_codon:yes gene_type:complete